MGRIVSVKRFEIHDGDGIRTTLFLKGCPLNCKWCHNPESIGIKPVLSYLEKKCVSCGECAKVCDCHSFLNDRHLYDRSNCVGCGKCEKACLGNALVLYGREITAKEILPELLEDKAFYETSDGGVTISGGEPLMQADFVAEILKMLKQYGVNTAVDTCGYAAKNGIDKVLPFTDSFLYDIKAIDESIHIKCTGRSNKTILENILYINSKGKKIEVRIPYVPTMNSGEISAIGKFLKPLENVKKVKVLPYHNYAGSKYQSLGLRYPMGDTKMPQTDEISAAVKTLRDCGLNAVNGVTDQ